MLSVLVGIVRRICDPRIERHLLVDDGEVLVDEVTHHWFAYVRAGVEAVAAAMLAVASIFAPVDFAWIVMVLVLIVSFHAFLLVVRLKRDRFVVTNMRVFRVHGVFSQNLATTPLSRILDITVVSPLHGRILRFGHFCFESAAQEQGLRDIRYVGRPYERDRTIQRVVQRAGLRGPRVPN